MTVEKTRDTRTRNWVFVAYPESVPLNWRDILDEQRIPWVESPLHDADENADGTEKKSHWHILLLYPGKKSYQQVSAVTKKINATVPQECQSAKGTVRYMAHLDNPEKKQYARSEIIGHGGIDVAEYLKPNQTARYQLIAEMIEWVEAYCITEFYELLIYAQANRFDDWFPLLCDNSAFVMSQFIRSFRHGMKEKKEQIERDVLYRSVEEMRDDNDL